MPEKKDLTVLNKWIDGPFRLSHHPMCTPFNGHTLNLFGRDVCRGCLFWYPGILLGLILGLVFGLYDYNKYYLAIIMFAFIAPTLLQLLIHIPRPIKDIARLLLGISTGLTFLVGIFPGHPDLLVRAIVIVVFLLAYIPLNVVRNNKNEAVCKSCPELPLRSDSKCSGYKIMRERLAIANTQLKIGITDINQVDLPVSSFDDI